MRLRLAACVFVLASAFAGPARADVRFTLLTRGAVPSDGHAPDAAGRIVGSRTAARRRLRAWDLDRALTKAAKVDFSRRRLVILIARGTSTADRLDLRRLTTSGNRLDAAARVTSTGIGGQSLARTYTLVTVPRTVKATSVRLSL